MASFNPFGLFGRTSSQTPRNTQLASTPLAGENDYIMDQIKRSQEYIKAYGEFSPNDWFGRAMAQQSVNQLLASDPRRQQQEIDMYTSAMDKLRSNANQEALATTLLLNATINVPEKMRRAGLARFEYAPEMQQHIANAGRPVDFVRRQYV